MRRSRCGNPDIGSLNAPDDTGPLRLASTNQGRSIKTNEASSYTAQGLVWPKQHLKWTIAQYPTRQNEIKSQSQLQNIIKQAFKDWEKHSGLKFEMAASKETADLKIKFFSKDHDDGYAFDGPGATLAHAFFPTNGDIHFDDDETFTDDYSNQNDKYTLRLVAAHEIGHALGLNHSFEEDSLMFPVYQQFSANYEISDDDKNIIKNLYGASGNRFPQDPSTTTSLSITSTHSSNGLPRNSWCSGDFQTGCEGPDGELYLFKDKHVWRYRARTKHSWDPEPKLISQRFQPVTDKSITACVKSISGYTYLFSHSNMWRVKTHWSIEGPHSIKAKNYPKNARVALFHNNSIYLIQSDSAYSLNEDNHHRNLKEYPLRQILNSPPREPIHSGFTYDKRHYLFARNQVYVYDSVYGNLIEGYPKSLPNGWFACDPTTRVYKWSKKPTKGRDRTDSQGRNNHHHHDYDDYHHDYHHHHHERKRPAHYSRGRYRND